MDHTDPVALANQGMDDKPGSALGSGVPAGCTCVDGCEWALSATPPGGTGGPTMAGASFVAGFSTVRPEVDAAATCRMSAQLFSGGRPN